MASKKNVQSKDESDATFRRLSALLDGAPTSAPTGFVNKAGDVKAWWPNQGAGGVQCTPLYANLSDSKQDGTKPSILVFARLDTARKLASSDLEQVIQCNDGDMIAFWAKPGMRQIRDCCGVSTWIQPTGEERDIGKGNPMKVYIIATNEGESGTRLPISEDRRVKSKGVKTFLHD